MSVDEIDTILLLRTRSPTDLGRKPVLQQNYIQIDRDKHGYTLFLYKNIFYKNIEAEIHEILRIF